MIQTVSLELAIQLKEAGFPQETTFYYWLVNGKYMLSIRKGNKIETLEDSFFTTYGNKEDKIIAAPTAEEIKLPGVKYHPYGEGIQKIDIWIENNSFTIRYLDDQTKTGIKKMFMYEKSLVEAIGKMRLYLKKHNIYS